MPKSKQCTATSSLLNKESSPYVTDRHFIPRTNIKEINYINSNINIININNKLHFSFDVYTHNWQYMASYCIIRSQFQTQGDQVAKNKLIGDPVTVSMYANQFSFLARPLTRELKADIDVAIVGIPFDLATTGRAGTRLGPNGIRQASSNLGWEGRRWPWDFDACQHLQIVDYGELDFIPGAPEDLNNAIAQHAKGILDSDTCMISMGGDHYVSLPLIRAHAEKHGKLALIHFDAHTDTYPNTTEIDHGSMFYHAPRQGLIDPEHSIQIGIRTEYRPEDHAYQVLDAANANDMSAADIVKAIKARVGDMPAYLTFDIDCLDPAFAPGTGTPVVGGLSSDKALKIIRGLKDTNIVGFDLVEVSPAYDHAQITALAGATLMVEFLYILAHQKRQRLGMSDS